MSTNNTYLEDTIHTQQITLSHRAKLDRKLIFSNNEKYNLWDLFYSNFLPFKFYPPKSEIEEELKSTYELMRIFENWKSLILTKKLSLLDFCKVIEKFTFHSETQDYRLKAIYKYKLIKKENLITDIGKLESISLKDSAGQSNVASNRISDLKIAELDKSLEGDGCGIDEKIRARREIALKRRKLLLINRT